MSGTFEPVLLRADQPDPKERISTKETVEEKDTEQETVPEGEDTSSAYSQPEGSKDKKDGDGVAGVPPTCQSTNPDVREDDPQNILEEYTSNTDEYETWGTEYLRQNCSNK